MNRSQLVFKAIDVFMYAPQNIVGFSKVTRIKDIPYSRISEDNKGDLYYCKRHIEKGKKLPVILNIHGGGFVMGDKAFRKSYSSYWAHKGYFVYNINYRLSPKVYFPENLNDVVDALNFLPQLAKRFPIDLNKIVVMGDSSGGYCTSYLAALAFNDGLSKKLGVRDVKVKPALIAPFCGIYDIKTLLKNKLPFRLVDVTAQTYLGFKLKKDFSNLSGYKYLNELSPINFVNEKWCPVFITWTDSDMICIKQGDGMYEKLVEKIGKENVGYFRTDGLLNNHCFHLDMTTVESKRCLAAASEYIASKLKEIK